MLAILQVGHPNSMEHILPSRILEHFMKIPNLNFGHWVIFLHENPDNLRVHGSFHFIVVSREFSIPQDDPSLSL